MAVIVPVALVVTACGSDPDTSGALVSSSTTVATATLGADATPATTATPSADDDQSDTTAATTTVASTTTTTTTTVAADPAQCVPGTWELRSQDFFDQITATAGDGATMTHLGGRHLATFNSDGTAEGLREAWSFEVAAPEGSLITTVDATDAGTWAVDGDTFTVSSQEQTFEASFEVLVGGVRQPLPIAPPNAVEADAFGGAGPYTCEGDVLTITLTDAGITITNAWDRIAG